jgi:hypothetical protein
LQRASVPLSHSGARTREFAVSALPLRLRNSNFVNGLRIYRRYDVLWHDLCIEDRNEESNAGLDQQRRWSGRTTQRLFFWSVVPDGRAATEGSHG